MKHNSVIDLLTKIQWPDPQRKGIAVWQGRAQGSKLPPTVNLTLTPNSLKAKVFNILSSDVPQPHLVAEFTFVDKDDQVQIVEWKDAGETSLTGSSQEKIDEAARQISAFITLVGGPPRVDFMGKLFKNEGRSNLGIE